MFLEFSQGTFIWQWFHSWAGLNAMTIALIVAALVVGLTRFTRISTCIKLLVAGGTVATLRSSFPILGGVTLQLFQGQDREPQLDVPANGVDLASSGSLSSQPRIRIRSVRSIDIISTAPARLVATERAIVNE
jgi:hypothetical protein